LLPVLAAYQRRDYPAALEAALRLDFAGLVHEFALRAACYAQLGRFAEAGAALDQLRAIMPDPTAYCPAFYGRFLLPDLAAHVVEGLRKAGLEQPPSARAATDGFGVAVAGFQAEGGDTAALASGLSAEIVTALSRFSYLRVLTNGTAGARYVLEGALRQAGAQVRVSARLTDTQTGTNLWAETYTRPYSPEKVFEIQDDLAPVIASAIADAHGVLPRSVSNFCAPASQRI
jgi:TolB-like protein